jgi:hypothetical protein
MELEDSAYYSSHIQQYISLNPPFSKEDDQFGIWLSCCLVEKVVNMSFSCMQGETESVQLMNPSGGKSFAFR